MPENAKETTKSEQQPAAEKFPVERLIADARPLVGYQPHEVAGALSRSGKTAMTVEEAKATTARWLNSPVADA